MVPVYFSEGVENLSEASGGLLDGTLLLGEFQVGLDHDLDELVELHRRLPPELALGLGRVADEELDLRG